MNHYFLNDKNNNSLLFKLKLVTSNNKLLFTKSNGDGNVSFL